MNHVKVVFEPRYYGILSTDKSQLTLGDGEGEFRPYDLVLGGLSACYYATFLSIARKMNLDYTKVEIEITGEKQTEPPELLRHVLVDVTVYGVSLEKSKQFDRAADVANRYCSVYQTISRVAEMETRLTLKPE